MTRLLLSLFLLSVCLTSIRVQHRVWVGRMHSFPGMTIWLSNERIDVAIHSNSKIASTKWCLSTSVISIRLPKKHELRLPAQNMSNCQVPLTNWLNEQGRFMLSYCFMRLNLLVAVSACDESTHFECIWHGWPLYPTCFLHWRKLASLCFGDTSFP